jgi:hypothetical protein
MQDNETTQDTKPVTQLDVLVAMIKASVYIAGSVAVVGLVLVGLSKLFR